MATVPFTCICGKELPHQERQADFKCAHCGRVYNYQGRFLWKEHPGNDVPGSSDLEEGGLSRRAEDLHPEDEDARQHALEGAFEVGALPEEPRRKTDEELFNEAVEAKAAKKKK